MSMLKGFFRLIRPVNTVICAFTVICGSIIGGKPLDYLYNVLISIYSSPFITNNSLSRTLCTDRFQTCPYIKIFTAALSASFILAAGNAFNDVCDLSCDRINTPNRPIPSGMVTPDAAAFFAGMLALIGIGLSVPLGFTGIVVALCAALLLLAYDMKLKGVPLLGNTVVACLGGLAFIYGGIAGDAICRSLIPATFAMLFHLGREIVKDAADAQGDSKSGIRTYATLKGIEAAGMLASIVLIVLMVVIAIPFATGYFGRAYGIVIVLGVWPALVYGIVILLKNPTNENMRRVSRVLKVAMPVGIVAVLVGFQGW